MKQISLFSGYEFRIGSIEQLNEQLKTATEATFWESASLHATAQMYFPSSEYSAIFEEIKSHPWSDLLSPRASVIFAAWLEQATRPIYHCQIPVEETDFLPDFTKDLLEKVGSKFSWKLEPAFGCRPFQGFKMALSSAESRIQASDLATLEWFSSEELQKFPAIAERKKEATVELLEIVQDDFISIFKQLKNQLENKPLVTASLKDTHIFLLPLWIRVRGVGLEDVKERNLPAIAGLTPIGD